MKWGGSSLAAIGAAHSLVQNTLDRFKAFSGQLTRLFLTFALAAMLITACGDGGGDSAVASNSSQSNNPPPPPPPPSGNSAPSISGTPIGQVAADSPYSFVPFASDSDSDTLTFSVVNLPPWAAFDEVTGELSGTPGQEHVGQYASIQITVSDGVDEATLSAFTIDVVAMGTGSALLSWTAPTENTDGSTLVDLDRFKIYWGRAPGNYTQSVELSVGSVSYLVEGLTQGTWYFAATAINESEVESSFSNIASKTIL